MLDWLRRRARARQAVEPPAGDTSASARAQADDHASFALNDLDRKLMRYLTKRDGFFVELGANDGVDQSNTYLFEKDRGWRGVLVEPVPHNYLACLRNRSERNHVVCAACVPFDFEGEFLKLIYSNLMTVSPDLDLDIADAGTHATTGLQFLPHQTRNFTFGALARPLTDILDEAAAPSRIDLLSLDVEGAELDVLKGLDLDKYRFDYMLIESRNVERLASHLQRHDYRIVDQLSEQDYLFGPGAA